MTDFDQFWQAYPRKQGGKKAAAKSYAKALTEVSHEEIMRGLAIFVAAAPWEGNLKWCALPTTWLNQGRWDDEYETPGSKIDDEIRERARNADRAQAGGTGGGADLRLVETPGFAHGFAASKGKP